uniref:Flavin-containing monooxygenase n=1 Tax=Nothoprocta perdicaria TaxID=30464 RepID=A0A8C6Z010_NOTPE
MAKRVAIIGAGSSGLCAIKACLDEGLEPVCFERSGDIGGLWRFEEQPEQGRASIYKSVIINTSKEMMCFSDFPIPDDFPNYMHHSKIMEYFRMYARHFQLLPHIRLRVRAARAPRLRPQRPVARGDGARRRAGGGHLRRRARVHRPPHGRAPAAAHYLHSRDYKDPQAFTDKRVIVIGIGNSGSDLAVEISQTAGSPPGAADEHQWGQAPTGSSKALGTRAGSSRQRRDMVQTLHRPDSSLCPCRFLHQHPTINDDLPNRIISGRVRVKPNIREFTATAAIFEDGTTEDNIDAVVFATGYSFAFPFLEDCVTVVENQIPLYKYVFPVHLEKPTLAFVGLIQPLGAIMPISELQCRWATRVFKGRTGPPARPGPAGAGPSRAASRRYVRSPRHTIQVDYIPYMDELAEQVGVRPSLAGLFLRDPRLAAEVLLGPCTPYQYRLRGPGRWHGARAAILTQRQRIIKPLRTRHVEEDAAASSVPLLAVLLAAVAAFALLLAYV